MFLMYFITQSNVSIYAWRGEKLSLTFFAPINPSKLSNVLNQLFPEYISFSFQDLSVKYHLSGIDVRVAVSICGSVQPLYVQYMCLSLCRLCFCQFKHFPGIIISRLLKICYSFFSNYIIESMQTDNHPSAEELSKKYDPCFWKKNLLGKWLVLMVSLK